MNVWKIKLLWSVCHLTLVAGLTVDTASAALNKGATSCDGGACTWSLGVDGNQVMAGTYSAFPDGTLFIDGAMAQMSSMSFSDGASIALNNVSGNIDPILGFSAAASTGAAGRTFSFNFSLPIALEGLVQASSSLSYTLTSTTAAGAQLTPLLGHTLIAQDVDTTVGGLPPVNKGVDIGNTFFVLGGPITANSPVYTASNVFPLTFDYDTMSATIAFGLSPNSQVGLSGFVQQVAAIEVSAVPEPSTYAFLCAGLGLLSWVARRQRSGNRQKP